MTDIDSSHRRILTRFGVYQMTNNPAGIGNECTHWIYAALFEARALDHDKALKIGQGGIPWGGLSAALEQSRASPSLPSPACGEDREADGRRWSVVSPRTGRSHAGSAARPRQDRFCFQPGAGHDLFEIAARRAPLARRGPRNERAEAVLIFLPSQKLLKQRFALRRDTLYRMPLANAPLIGSSAIVRPARICGIALGLALHARGTDLRSVDLRRVTLRRHICRGSCKVAKQRDDL